MAKDIRIRMDLVLPPEATEHRDAIRDALTPFLKYGIVIHEGTANEERGFIEVEACGHRTGDSCEIVARWEVGRGRVIF